MPTLGQIIVGDLRDRLNDSGFLHDALEFVSDTMIQSIKDSSEYGYSADGSFWEELSESHANKKGGDYTSDLRFKFYKDIGAMDKIYASLSSDDTFNFEFGDQRTDYYMTAHQYGLPDGRSVMPERRWAPEEEDMRSPMQQENLKEIEQFITDYLNESVTVHGAQIISM